MNSFSVLMFVPRAPEALAEIKGTVCTAFYLLILRLEFSHNAIKNKVYYDLAIVHYIIFQISKENVFTGQKQ